jgi:hypothetical protein
MTDKVDVTAAVLRALHLNFRGMTRGKLVGTRSVTTSLCWRIYRARCPLADGVGDRRLPEGVEPRARARGGAGGAGGGGGHIIPRLGTR